MPNRALDWLRQALRDMEQAEDSRDAGRHGWACFVAHQAAEKAAEAWGHVIARLLEQLPEPIVVQKIS